MLRVLSWIIALCGLWEAEDVVLPFIIGFDRVQPLVWGHIIAGIVLVIAGVWAARTVDVQTARTMDWSATIAGAWLVIAPFGFHVPRTGAFWNDVIVGALVLILASASGLLRQRRG